MPSRILNRRTRWIGRAAFVFVGISALVNARVAFAGDTVPGRAPTSAEVREACGYVAKAGPSIRSELLRDASIDVRNDGRLVDATIGVDNGTAGGETFEYRERGSPKDAPPIETSFFDDRPWADRGFGARWLRYKSHTYALVFESENLRRLKHLSLIDEKNREHLACTFTAREHETLLPTNDDARSLCRAVALRQVRYLPVSTDSTSTVRYAGGPRADTGVAGVTIADFTNSDVADKLAELEFAHGGGRGAAATYYDIVVDGEKSILRQHELLMALQHVVALRDKSGDVVEPSFADDNISRLFSYRGLTYFDIAATGGDAYAGAPFHEVRLLQGDRIATECAGRFCVSWKLSEIVPEYR